MEKQSKLNELFAKPLVVVNFGIESFYEELKSQNIQVLQMNWKPAAGGNKKLAGMLDLLK